MKRCARECVLIDSVIELDTETQSELQAEMMRKIRAVPHMDMSEMAGSTPEVPQEIRIGDNPLFQTFVDARKK